MSGARGRDGKWPGSTKTRPSVLHERGARKDIAAIKSVAESERPLISVIIPCYNQASFLGEAIDSLTAQSYPRVEIVVVDDGSTDDVLAVLAHYPTVRYIRQNNQGLPAARNRGWRASHGDYVLFLDADDRLLGNALESGLNCLMAHPDCAFASGRYRYIREDGSPFPEVPQEAIVGDPYLALLRGNYIGMHATVLYRRTALEATRGFDPSLRACEDYDLYLRIARQFPVCRHDTVVAEYRQHGSNMSRDNAFMLKSALAVLGQQEEQVNGNKQYRVAYEQGMRGWKQYYGEKIVAEFLPMVRRGQIKQAVERLAVLLRVVPEFLLEYIVRRVTLKGYRTVKRFLPALIRDRLEHSRRFLCFPPVGRVRFGDLRRVTPISREFGYDRGLPVDRYYIEDFLARHANDVRGQVLEIGDDSYTRRFGAERVAVRDVLHVVAGHPGATIVADLTSAEHIPSNTFDCIILTQTLHLIYDVRSAIRTLYRVLKPGGVLLATVPGISQTSVDEWEKSWYWSFTVLSVQRLFAEMFSAENVSVEAKGNVLAATAFLHGLAVEELLPAELDYHDPHYQLLIAVRAVKAREGL